MNKGKNVAIVVLAGATAFLTGRLVQLCGIIDRKREHVVKLRSNTEALQEENEELLDKFNILQANYDTLAAENRELEGQLYKNSVEHMYIKEKLSNLISDAQKSLN